MSVNRPHQLMHDDPRLPSVWEPEERLWLIVGILRGTFYGTVTLFALLVATYLQLIPITVETILIISCCFFVFGGAWGSYSGLIDGARQREERAYIDSLPKEELEQILRAVKKAFHIRGWVLIESIRITRLSPGQLRICSNPQGVGLRGILVMDMRTKEIIDEEWKQVIWNE